MEMCTEVGIAVCERIEGREIPRLAAPACAGRLAPFGFAQGRRDDYHHRIVDFESQRWKAGGGGRKCGKQRIYGRTFLEVWQRKELAAGFTDVWQTKELGKIEE